MINTKIICTCCPIGCILSITNHGEEEIIVTGNACPRGKTYAITEITDPRRIVTSTVRVKNSNASMISVKTKEGVPKDKMLKCIEELKAIELEPPIYSGDVVKANIAGTGIDVIATRDIVFY